MTLSIRCKTTLSIALTTHLDDRVEFSSLFYHLVKPTLYKTTYTRIFLSNLLVWVGVKGYNLVRISEEETAVSLVTLELTELLCPTWPSGGAKATFGVSVFSRPA